MIYQSRSQLDKEHIFKWDFLKKEFNEVAIYRGVGKVKRINIGISRYQDQKCREATTDF